MAAKPSIVGGVRHYHFDSDGYEQTSDFCVEGEFSGTADLNDEENAISDCWIASLLKRVPHYQIASFLGMTPETLSRVRSRGGYNDW